MDERKSEHNAWLVTSVSKNWEKASKQDCVSSESPSEDQVICSINAIFVPQLYLSCVNFDISSLSKFYDIFVIFT